MKSIAIAIAATIVLSLLFIAGLFSNIQLSLADSLYGGKQALDNIVIVAIDDKSIQQVGRWPWDRDVIARLIDKIDGAKVIGLDLGFYEPTNKDEILANAMRRAGNVVLPIEFIDKGILVPVFTDATLGYANVIQDNDGVVRAVNLALSYSYKAYASAIID